MAKKLTLQSNKTYATEANADKAVEKTFGDDHGLRYFVMRTADGRFFPVFVGRDEVMQAGVHFHFTCVG